MARKIGSSARFVKKGQACPVGWRKKTIVVRGGKRELCVAPKK